MDAIYSLMGVCPQHDLLWETLTGACVCVWGAHQLVLLPLMLLLIVIVRNVRNGSRSVASVWL
jgi:hypothetical protein